MQYIISLVLIFVLIDIYYRFRKTQGNIFLLRFIALLVIRFEKLLLKEKFIDSNEVEYTRNLIREQISDKDFQKLKNIFLSLDPDYHNALVALFGSETITDKKAQKEKQFSLKDIIFNRQYRRLKNFIKEVEKKNIEEFGQNEDEWVEDKYGKEFFNEK